MVWNLCSNPQCITCPVPHLSWPPTSCHKWQNVLTKTGPASSEIPFTHCTSELVSFTFLLFFSLWTSVLFPPMFVSLLGFGGAHWVHEWAGGQCRKENGNMVVVGGLVSHKELQQGWGRDCKYPKVLHPGLVFHTPLPCPSSGLILTKTNSLVKQSHNKS